MLCFDGWIERKSWAPAALLSAARRMLVLGRGRCLHAAPRCPQNGSLRDHRVCGVEQCPTLPRVGNSSARSETRLKTKIGWTLTTVVVLILLMDAAIDLFAVDRVAPTMIETGFTPSLAPVLAAICLLCAILYAVPRTAVLGAILITGFFGGAICTHLRIGEIGSPPQLLSVVIAAMAWGALWLRDARVRELLPLSTDSSTSRAR